MKKYILKIIGLLVVFFTKDHDFVEIKYEDKTLYVDPSLNIINFKN